MSAATTPVLEKRLSVRRVQILMVRAAGMTETSIGVVPQ
jgi:hypothetical protein